jgi:hypothetical protein
MFRFLCSLGEKQKSPAWWAPILCVVFAACTDDTGCDGILPLETTLPADAYDDEAVSVYIAEQGVEFLENNILQILTTFAETSCDDLHCPADYGMCNADNNCVSVDPTTPMVGIKVESSSFTGGELCPPGITNFEDCNAYILLNDIELTPTTGDADLLVDINVDVVTTRFKISVLLSDCNMDIEPLSKSVSTTVTFSNENPLERLEVEIGELDFAITDEDIDKIDFSGGLFGSCNIIDLIFPLFRDTVSEELTATLQETVDEAQRDLLWEPCVDTECSRTDLSTCSEGWCYFDEDNSPVPALLGLEGRLDLEFLLAEFAPGAGGLIDFSLGATSGSAADQGLRLNMRGGTDVEDDPCVPFIERPENSYPAYEPPLLTPGGQPFDLALGISDAFLNRIMHNVFTSGALCLTLGGDAIPQLNSSAFSLLTPSLAELLPETKPLTVDIRPRALPRLEIGRNLSENNGEENIVEPLMTLVLDDFDMDLYVPMHSALTRIMTLQLDLAIDLGLAIGAAGELVLVAGDGTDWVLDARVLNSAILRESPTDIEDAIPVLLGIVLPLLTESLNQSFEIPSASGFVLNVKEISGTQEVGETVRNVPRFAHMNLFADLQFSAEAMRAPSVQTQATIVDVQFPTDSALRNGAISEVRLNVGIAGRDPGLPPPMVWVRVDEGLWHHPVQTDHLVVRDLRLQVPGPHLLEVAAALPGIPSTLDLEPVQFQLIADFAAPTVALTSGDAGIIQIQVSDDVDRPQALSISLFENSVAQRAPIVDVAGFANWTPRHSMSHIVVVVEDQAGHQTWAEWGDEKARESVGAEAHVATLASDRQERDLMSPADSNQALHCASTRFAAPDIAMALVFFFAIGCTRRRRHAPFLN